MRPDDWHLTEDLDRLLVGGGDFLHSRPALHTLPPTVTETLRTRGVDPPAVRLTGLGRCLPGVSADHDTATAFADAWQRYTGPTPTLHQRQLYRLGTLTPPRPLPRGQRTRRGQTGPRATHALVPRVHRRHWHARPHGRRLMG